VIGSRDAGRAQEETAASSNSAIKSAVAAQIDGADNAAAAATVRNRGVDTSLLWPSAIAEAIERRMEAGNGGDRYDGSTGGDGRRLTDTHDRRMARLGSAGGGRIAPRRRQHRGPHFKISARNCWQEMGRSIATCLCAAMTITQEKLRWNWPQKFLECVR